MSKKTNKDRNSENRLTVDRDLFGTGLVCLMLDVVLIILSVTGNDK